MQAKIPYKYAVTASSNSTDSLLCFYPTTFFNTHHINIVIVLVIENSRSCAGKWLYNNRLWFCSREFTTLKGIESSG